MTSEDQSDQPSEVTTLLRGLRSSSCINGEFVTAEAFEPPKGSEAARAKKGLSLHMEVSVNWEDGKESISQLRSNEANCRSGIARVEIARVKEANSVARAAMTMATIASVERHPVDGNEFHGNILFDPAVDQRLRRRVQTAIALWASVI